MQTIWIKRICAFAKRHGVRVVRCSKLPYMYGQEVPTDFYFAPFRPTGLAIEWKQKVLYYTPEARFDELIHELGHILACRVAPPKSEEGVFFGWEYRLAHRITKGTGMHTWRQNNGDYSINEPDIYESCIGRLNDSDYQTVIDRAVAEAKRAGLLTTRGAPVVVR